MRASRIATISRGDIDLSPTAGRNRGDDDRLTSVLIY
jgi:hypothetical protein